MKHLQPALVLMLVFGGLITAAHCKKDDASAIRIEGFDMYDSNGGSLGHVGPADHDWSFSNTLSDREMALFNFATDVTLDNTTEAAITTFDGVYVRPMPNPTTYMQNYYLTTSDSVVMKVVVVNGDLKVLDKSAIKVKGQRVISMYFGDRAVYPNRSSLRVYYSFSAKNKPNYRAGYGDIKICEGTGNINDNSCF